MPTKRQKIVQTFLFDATFILVAMSTMSPYVALLDLADLYETTLDRISIIFSCNAIGNFVGSLSVILVSKKYPQSMAIFTLGVIAFRGTTGSLFPFMANLWSFYAIVALFAITSGFLYTALNAMCLELWRGENGGPYLHSFHLSFTLGALILPLIMKPFISGPNENSSWGIQLFFPMIGVTLITISLFYIPLIKRTQEKLENSNDTDEEKAHEKEQIENSAKGKILFIFLVTTFYFFNVAAELTFFSYLPSYGVIGQYRLTRKESGLLSTLLAAGLMTSRAFSIFLSTKVEQIHILSICSIGMILVQTGLCLFAESHIYALYSLIFMFGLSNGPIFAGAFLWMEGVLKDHGGVSKPTNAFIMAIVTISIGLSPAVIGQFIEYHPYIIFYCSAIFSLASISFFILAFRASKEL